MMPTQRRTNFSSILKRNWRLRFRSNINLPTVRVRHPGLSQVTLSWITPLLLLVSLLLVSGALGCRRTEPVNVKVVGISMAPLLIGEHDLIECGRCWIEFTIVDQQLPRDGKLVCPNCGSEHDRKSSRPGSGDFVELELLGPSEPLQRWDVVAIARDDNKNYMVKRIIGLPGETVQFIDGNVRIDGRLVRVDPLTIASSGLIAVYRFDHEVSPLKERFTSFKPNSRWTVDAQGLFYRGSPSLSQTGQDDSSGKVGSIDDESIDWLVYQHRRCYRRNTDRFPDTIDDFYAINQNLTRETHAVAELLVRIRLDSSSRPVVHLRVHDGHDYQNIGFDFLRHYVVFEHQTYAFPESPGNPESSDISVSWFDDQLAISVNGHNVVYKSFDRIDADQAVVDAVSLGGINESFLVQELAIYRHVFYDRGPRANQSAWQLGDDQYFVVGDNIPISRDSREWAPQHLTRDRIIGKVKLD